jgi:hypothetical protein
MKIYVVALHLSKKIPAGYLGFSDYVTCFVQAETDMEAQEKAKAAYSHRYDLTVNKMKVWEAKEQNPDNYQEQDRLIR